MLLFLMFGIKALDLKKLLKAKEPRQGLAELRVRQPAGPANLGRIRQRGLRQGEDRLNVPRGDSFVVDQFDVVHPFYVLRLTH